MGSIGTIISENLPCWYDLSWDKERKAIIFRIHKEMVENIKSYFTDNNRLIKIYKEELSFEEFGMDFSGDFGFEKVFKLTESRGDFICFLIKIRSMEITERQCFSCKGTGEGLFEGEKCFQCNGKGKEEIYDIKPFRAISATFSVLFRYLDSPKIKTSSILPQLMTVETVTKLGDHGGSLSGEFSLLLADYLRSFASEDDRVHIPEMIEVMKDAYEQMNPKGSYLFDNKFQAYIRDKSGFFVASCPGDRTDIYTDSADLYPNTGYKFYCHNVDSPIQQITFLTGLAALSDKARREIILC